MSAPVALYTLGQTPRPDLVPPMVAALNAPDVRVIGVLDGVDPSEIRAPLAGNYPLKTRMSDGTEVQTDCAFLRPRLQELISAHDEDVLMHMVLSVAPFKRLRAEGTLVRPFEHGCRALAARHIHEICVIVPYREQVFHAHQKWEFAGFSAHIHCVEDRKEGLAVEQWVAECTRGYRVDGVVIDFVGYSKGLTTKLETALGLPVIDLGFEAMRFGKSLLEEFESIEAELSTNMGLKSRFSPIARRARMRAN